MIAVKEVRACYVVYDDGQILAVFDKADDAYDYAERVCRGRASSYAAAADGFERMAAR